MMLTSINNGNWSDPNIWDAGRTPQFEDDVKIQLGHTVIYDVENTDPIRSIHIRGKLEFSKINNTHLVVGLIVLNPLETIDIFDRCSINQHPMDPVDHDNMPVLDIGTLNNPIPHNVNVMIELVHFDELDSNCGPAILNTSGILEINGNPVKTWSKLAEEAIAGTTTLVTVDDTNYFAGQTVLITGTEKEGDFVDDSDSYRVTGNSQTEFRTIQAINGNVITLTQPLSFTHYANGLYAGEVALVNRNITIKTSEGEDVNGHTMTHHHGMQRISYAQFDRLGKEGILGRYPIHFHLLGNMSRGSYVIGNYISRSDNRFITVHGTQYALVKDNVGYQSIGHGYFLENGMEVFNVFHNNLSVLTYVGNKIPGQALEYDNNDGAGFWWANPMNVFKNNAVAETDKYGYLYDIRDDIYLPILNADGTTETKQVERLPGFRFDDNEVHGCLKYSFWGNGFSPETMPITIRNFKSWKNHYGFAPNGRNYYVSGLKIYDSAYGIYGPEPKDTKFENVTALNISNPSFMLYKKPEGLIVVDGITCSVKRSDRWAFRLTGKDVRPRSCEAHIRNYNVLNGLMCTTEGGNAKDTPLLSITFHDYYGDNQHAKVVPAGQNHGDTTYGTESGFDGQIKVGQVSGEFPISPIQDNDDILPVSFINYPRNGQHLSNNVVTVKGATMEKTPLTNVSVNGIPVTPLEDNYLLWEVDLVLPSNQRSDITVESIDVNGNIEVNNHTIHVHVGEVTTTNIQTPTLVSITR